MRILSPLLFLAACGQQRDVHGREIKSGDIVSLVAPTTTSKNTTYKAYPNSLRCPVYEPGSWIPRSYAVRLHGETETLCASSQALENWSQLPDDPIPAHLLQDLGYF